MQNLYNSRSVLINNTSRLLELSKSLVLNLIHPKTFRSTNFQAPWSRGPFIGCGNPKDDDKQTISVFWTAYSRAVLSIDDTN
jgi:hypothetical protein